MKKYQRAKKINSTSCVLKRIVILLGIILASGTVITGIIVSQKDWIQAKISDYKASKAVLQLTSNEITVELGSELRIQATDLVETSEMDINRIVIDIEEVNVAKVGIYEGYVQYMEQRETFFVNVVDTVAPNITLTNDLIYVMNGQRCLLNNYIESVEELSGSVKIRLEELLCEMGEVQNRENVSVNELYFNAVDVGQKEGILIAVDENNNESRIPLKIIVVNQPVITVSEEVKEFMDRDAAIDYLNTIVAIDDIDGETKNGLYYDVSELGEEPGEYSVFFCFTNSLNFITEETQIIRIVEPIVEVVDNATISESKPYWQTGSAVRDTSLILQGISLVIDGVKMDFEPDVRYDDPRIDGKSYYTNSLLATWSNGSEELVLDAGSFWTNYNPKDYLNGVTFSIGVIVAHQEVEYEGDIYTLYLNGRGSVFMDTNWLRPHGSFSQEMMEEAFGDLSGWIYY